MRPERILKHSSSRWVVALLLAILTFSTPLPFAGGAELSVCEKAPRAKIGGSGPLPYNYRIIDGHIHAGGHPLNPRFTNSDAQTLSILNYLKSKGVKTVIDLENTQRIQNRYKTWLKKVGFRLIHVPMSASKVPTAAEWTQIKKAMEGPVYVHCQWGADRTGIVIAKYLVDEKGYSKAAALRAVKTGGSHAGLMGGLKPALYGKAFREFLGKNDPDRPQKVNKVY